MASHGFTCNVSHENRGKFANINIYMESLENLTIEELQQLLKEKGQEIADIFAKLSEAGAAEEIPDDFMDQLVW